MKKFISTLVAVVMIGSIFCGCSAKDSGKSSGKENKKSEKNEEGSDDEESGSSESSESSEDIYGSLIYSTYYEGKESLEDAPKDLANAYGDIKISPEMIYGDRKVVSDDSYDKYTMDQVNYTIDDFYAQNVLVNINEFMGFSDVSYENMSPLPIDFNARPYPLSALTGEYMCQIGYHGSYDETLTPDNFRYFYVYALYEIKDNKITFKYLSNYSIEDEVVINYELSGVEQTYDLSINYNSLTFGYEGKSSTLYTRFGNSFDSIYLTDGWSQTSDKLDSITKITFFSEGKDDQGFSVGVDVGDEYPKTCYGIARLSKEGVMSFEYTDPDEVVHTHHGLVIDNGLYGFIFIEGDKVHRFNDNSESSNELTVQNKGYVAFNVLPEDESKLEELTTDDIEVINEATDNFMDDLTKELASEGINVSIDENTGAIIIDAAVLFDNNEYEIGEDGQAYLTVFANAFAKVITNDEYEGLFSSIVVQGHTDSNGTEEHNQELSLNRANSVRDYIISATEDSDAASTFANLLVTEGCASQYLIYNDDGTENQAASRRVIFMFYVDLDYVK